MLFFFVLDLEDGVKVVGVVKDYLDKLLVGVFVFILGIVLGIMFDVYGCFVFLVFKNVMFCILYMGMIIVEKVVVLEVNVILNLVD